MTLEVKPRDAKASTDALRKKGSIPAVLYGPKEAPQSIEIDAKEFERVFRKAGETTLIKLTGIGDEKETLVHDIQRHPVTDTVLHADFYVLEKGKKVTLSIPLEFTGTAPAEKAGHIVVKTLHEIEIEVAPADIPQHLEIDLSKLANVGDHILAKDIKLPASAELITNADEIVVSVTEIKEEKAETPAVAAEGAEGAAAGAEAESKES
jgi:large subunit ribosomal protein L25